MRFAVLCAGLAATALVLAAGCGAPASPRADGPVPASAGDQAGSGEAASEVWWRPGPQPLPWQWELDHPLNLSSARDMGTGVTAYGGRPAAKPVVYDIDGFANPAATVASLHRRGDKVICYIEVGAAESYRPDYRRFPASVLGRAVPSYPQERYLDIRSAVVPEIMEERIAMCATKGFDAVETDIDESYGADTGFPLTKAIEESYMRTLAAYMHAHRLAWVIKNPDDTGDTYATDMAPLADAVLTEQCNENSTCGYLSAYTHRKLVLNAEYNLPLRQFCPADARQGWSGVSFPVILNGPRQPCR
jgi:hypothetical protein